MNSLIDTRSGSEVVIVSVCGGRGAHQRLAEMGLLPGEKIRIINNAGVGPVMLNVKGSKLALGHGLAQKIVVKEG